MKPETTSGAGRGPGVGHEPPTYQGSRFPWWLTVLWLVFMGWAFIYLAVFYLDDLKAWLLK